MSKTNNKKIEIDYTTYRDACARARDKHLAVAGREDDGGIIAFYAILLEKELFGEMGDAEF